MAIKQMETYPIALVGIILEKYYLFVAKYSSIWRNDCSISILLNYNFYYSN